MTQIRKFLPSLALVGALALVPVTASSFAAADTTNYQELEKFMSVYQQVKQHYVVPVDDHTLLKGAIDGMLSALDPHSSYAEGADYDALKTLIDGSYGGLGLSVGMEDGTIKVISPTEDTPAWKAGIKAGDYISHINGELIYGYTLDEAVEKMRGKPGTKVRIGESLGRALGPIGVELSQNGRQVSPALIAGSSETLSNTAKGG